MTVTRDHDLTVESVRLGEIRPHPENYRHGDVGALSVLLDQHGQYQPLIVQRSTGYIIAGSHRWKAMRSLGWDEAGVVFLDVDDDQARMILAADNRASDLATNDVGRLSELLARLATADLLEGTGYDGEDVDRLIADANRLHEQRPAALPHLAPSVPPRTDEPDPGEDDPPGEDDEPARPAGGNPVIAYSLVFDDADQQAAWFAFLRALRVRYPGATHAARVVAYLADHPVPEPDES